MGFMGQLNMGRLDGPAVPEIRWSKYKYKHALTYLHPCELH